MAVRRNSPDKPHELLQAVLTSIHLVLPDQHAHYQHSNDRADLLANLIVDLRPDVVINIGDAADLPSLCTYDKGKRSFVGRTYRADIDAHCDFQHRLWEPVARRKKKMPRRVFCIGNHEERINTALNVQPELSGTISLSDLRLSDWYDEIVAYEGQTPGVVEIDGILYAHYFTSGVLGRSVSGEHAAYSLLGKLYTSATMGHSHLFDYCVRTRGDGSKIMGLSVGCYQDYTNDWAGEIGKLWDRGVAIKRNVENGAYDLEWVSLERLRKEYG